MRIGAVLSGGTISFRALGTGIGLGPVKPTGSIERELVVEVKVDTDSPAKRDESETGENGKENDSIDLTEPCAFEEPGSGLRQD